MAEREIEIRPPTRDDLPAIGDLYYAVKGRHRPESVDRWRLFDTPWGDSVSLIALDGDVCVALGIVWPAMLRVGTAWPNTLWPEANGDPAPASP